MTNKKIKTHSDYTKFSSGYQLSLALDFPILIPKNEPVRLLNEILEGLDDTKLEAAYSEEGRNPAVPPIILFKILVYAYMKRAYSSRDILTLCKENINFIILSGFFRDIQHLPIIPLLDFVHNDWQKEQWKICLGNLLKPFSTWMKLSLKIYL